MVSLIRFKVAIDCHSEVRLQMLFKHMNFSKTFQKWCIRVTLIPGNKTHKSNDFFLLYFPIHQEF